MNAFDILGGILPLDKKNSIEIPMIYKECGKNWIFPLAVRNFSG
jgi:hypothetical protein